MQPTRMSRDRWNTPRLLALGIGTCVVTIAVLRLWPPSGGFVLGVAGTLCVISLVVSREVSRRLRRYYQENRAILAHFRSRLDATGFETASDTGVNRRPWSELRKWREDSELILLYESTDVFRIIPKRLLQEAGQLEDARRLLLEHLGPAA